MFQNRNFPVAHHITSVKLERLHTGRGQSHDRETVKTEQTSSGVHDPAVVWPAGFGSFEPGGGLPAV